MSTSARKFSSLNVLGKKIQIKYQKMDDWGECDEDNLIIRLSKECLEEGNEDHHFKTICHEVSHLIKKLAGISYMERYEEEAITRCEENLIIPWVLEFEKKFYS